MTFMMKSFALAARRKHSRPTEKRSVSCETLECRQLLSIGMQTAEVAHAMPDFASGGWESRWIDTMPVQATTGAQSQLVSNLGNSGLGTFFVTDPAGTQTQVMSGELVNSSSDGIVSGSSTNASPASIEIGQGAAPIQIASTGSAGSAEDASVSDASFYALPAGARTAPAAQRLRA